MAEGRRRMLQCQWWTGFSEGVFLVVSGIMSVCFNELTLARESRWSARVWDRGTSLLAVSLFRTAKGERFYLLG